MVRSVLERLEEDCQHCADSNIEVHYFGAEIQASDCNTHSVDSADNAVAGGFEKHNSSAEKRAVAEAGKREYSRSPADTVTADKVEAGKQGLNH